MAALAATFPAQTFLLFSPCRGHRQCKQKFMRGWSPYGGSASLDSDVELLDAEQVVTILEFASLCIEAPAADVATLRADPSAPVGDDISGHRVRLVLDVDDRVCRCGRK
jgi:hypothetical protein